MKLAKTNSAFIFTLSGLKRLFLMHLRFLAACASVKFLHNELSFMITFNLCSVCTRLNTLFLCRVSVKRLLHMFTCADPWPVTLTLHTQWQFRVASHFCSEWSKTSPNYFHFSEFPRGASPQIFLTGSPLQCHKQWLRHWRSRSLPRNQLESSVLRVVRTTI